MSLKVKRGFCPKHKKVVVAITRTDCPSLFCSECNGWTKLFRKEGEE